MNNLFKNKSADAKEASTKELDLQTLAPCEGEQAEWKQSILYLQDLSNSIDSAKTNTEKERIIYLVSTHGIITPRLQKSKDGIEWSKKRDVQLASFRLLTIPGMNEMDRRIAGLVRTSGRGGRTTHELGGAKTLVELIGYPLVFSHEYPDKQVTIIKDQPCLTLAKVPNGYRAEINIKYPITHLGMIIQKDNDLTFRVMEVGIKQWDILDTFQRTPDFPVEAREQLAPLLRRLKDTITIHSDLLQVIDQPKLVKGDPQTVIYIRTLTKGIQVKLLVKPFTNYPPYCKAGTGTDTITGEVDGEYVQAVRNTKKEMKNFLEVSSLLQEVLQDRGVTNEAIFEHYGHFLSFLEMVEKLDKISCIEWADGKIYTINGMADSHQLKLSFKRREQWVEISGELVVDAALAIGLPELLGKIQQSKGRFVRLTGCNNLALSEKLYLLLLELGNLLIYDPQKRLKIPLANIFLIMEREKDGVELSLDEGCQGFIQQVGEANRRKVLVPKALQANLRQYQLDGYQWLVRLSQWSTGACLADDIGLGKTLQTITFLLGRTRKGPSLVVVPKPMLCHWEEEFKSCAPTLSVLNVDSASDRLTLIKSASTNDVVLYPYTLFSKDKELLHSRRWNVLVLDEAHELKGRDSLTVKTVEEMQVEFRLFLSNRPLLSCMETLWIYIQSINPGLLGAYWQFTERYVQASEMALGDCREEQLKKLIHPYVLRRTKVEVHDWIPRRTKITLTIQLNDQERVSYEKSCKKIIPGSKFTIHVLKALENIRRELFQPGWMNDKLCITSSKIEALMNLISHLKPTNSKIVVFFEFTEHLGYIRKELDRRNIGYLCLDKFCRRSKWIQVAEEFRKGKHPILLIDQKVNAVSLNLAAADCVIYADPWWSTPADELTFDHVYRLGQTHPVTIYKLIAAQTVEEMVIRKLQEDALNGVETKWEKLTVAGLLELLKK